MTLWNGPSWQANLHITPSFNVHYADGYTQGTGYIDSTTVSSPATETFTVSGGDKIATSVSAAGSGLMFTLQTSGGTTVATGTGSASTYPGWQTYLFPAPITLKNGQAYNLVISGSVYRAVQKGNNYGMYTAFPDGRYTGNIAYDLQFYFTLSQAAVQIPAPTGLSIVSSTTSQVTLGWDPAGGLHACRVQDILRRIERELHAEHGRRQRDAVYTYGTVRPSLFCGHRLRRVEERERLFE